MDITKNYQLKSYNLISRQVQINPIFGSRNLLHNGQCIKKHNNVLIAANNVLKIFRAPFRKMKAMLKDLIIDKRIKTALSNKPIFATYHSNGEKTVKEVGMGNYLTVNATEKEQYIGTNGLGPCIGLSVVNKKSGKPINMSIAHVVANTDLSSLDRLFYAMKEPSELYITLISHDNETWIARKILRELLKLNNDKVKNISVDLSCSPNFCSTSFALNTKTGEICIDIPHTDFDIDKNKRSVIKNKLLQKSSHQTLVT